MTCTDRPAGQRWHFYNNCVLFGQPVLRGNDVIGSGTSEGRCSIGATETFGARFLTS